MVTPIASDRAGAPALRQMLVEELSNQYWVDPLPTVPEVRPSGEMRDAAKISLDRLCSVPALVQVLLERTNAWPDRPVGETVYVSAMGAANDVHGDLQKWDHHCIYRRELCPDPYSPALPEQCHA
jgi:hypothetical protein